MKRLIAIIAVGLSISVFAISQACDKPQDPQGYWVDQNGVLVYYKPEKVVPVL